MGFITSYPILLLPHFSPFVFKAILLFASTFCPLIEAAPQETQKARDGIERG